MIKAPQTINLACGHSAPQARPFSDIAERLQQAAADLRRQAHDQPSVRNREILDLAARLERIAEAALTERS